MHFVPNKIFSSFFVFVLSANCCVIILPFVVFIIYVCSFVEKKNDTDILIQCFRSNVIYCSCGFKNVFLCVRDLRLVISNTCAVVDSW